MDPITLALVTAVITAVVTKPTEQAVEKLGDGIVSAGQNLFKVLGQKSPDTAKQLEAAADNGGEEVIDAEIIEEVKRVAAEEPTVQAAINETVAAVQAEQSSLQQLTKLADKIGVVNMATVQNQTNNISI